MLELQGKTALITAGSRGIGAASAKLLAEMGARIFLVSRSQSKLDKTLSSLPGQGHICLACDLSSEEGVTFLLEQMKDFGAIHILINNMAGPAPGPLVDTDPTAFEAGLKNHVVLAHKLMQACVVFMKDAGYGRIVNIISTSVKIPIPNLGVSNTTRGAMANWAKTLSLELAPHQITVNNVLPGFTETDRLASLIGNRAKKSGQSEDQVAENMKKGVPMGRFGTAEECAQAVAFLASPRASYITGINIPVDGGRTGCL